MRDEILAWYGYSFPDAENPKRYDSQWYFPVYDDRSEFADLMTEIDRHNLAFLEHFINPSIQPEEIEVTPEVDQLRDTDSLQEIELATENSI